MHLPPDLTEDPCAGFLPKGGLDNLDYLCEKGTELEKLISAVDATTPITPEQASPAYACVMYNFLRLLGWVAVNHTHRVVQSKHASDSAGKRSCEKRHGPY